MSIETVDLQRRFGGVIRLYGEAGFAKLQSAHIVVIGIGGVGSWAVEALARHAVGQITLIDLDNIAESNVNRQLHAVEDTFGLAKVTAMARRVLSINPLAKVNEIEDFITPENIVTLLDVKGLPSPQMVIDCVDDAKAKIALATFCKRNKQPMVMSGSAGGRLDPTHIQVADLSAVSGDKLLAKVRNQLRRDHGFPKASQQKKSAKFSIPCVYSDEPVVQPNEVCVLTLESSALAIGAQQSLEPQQGVTGLNCAGYGSSVCVTATFGFALANLAIKAVLAT